jgi:hypothetical protein
MRMVSARNVSKVVRAFRGRTTASVLPHCVGGVGVAVGALLIAGVTDNEVHRCALGDLRASMKHSLRVGLCGHSC